MQSNSLQNEKKTFLWLLQRLSTGPHSTHVIKLNCKFPLLNDTNFLVYTTLARSPRLIRHSISGTQLSEVLGLGNLSQRVIL